MQWNQSTFFDKAKAFENKEVKNKQLNKYYLKEKRKGQMILKKKIWKQIIAAIMACALITGTAGSNTTLAASNKKNITAASLTVKVSGKTAKERNIAGNIKPEEKTPDLDKMLDECEEIQTDTTTGETTREIRKGQTISVESISGSDTKMAIMSNGDLYCWGDNVYGQVGILIPL